MSGLRCWFLCVVVVVVSMTGVPSNFSTPPCVHRIFLTNYIHMRKTLVVLSKKGLTLSDKSVVLLWLASAVVAFLVYFYHIQNPAPCEEPVVVEPRLQHLTGEPVELEQ